MKKDKSVKIALDSRKLNEVTVKRKPQMPIMEELISQISRKISVGTDGEILATKLEFDYAYGQIKLDESTKKISVFFAVTGGDSTEYYRFLKGFYEMADFPTLFQERTDTALEHKHPAWLDDIITVTKENMYKSNVHINSQKVRIFQ